MIRPRPRPTGHRRHQRLHHGPHLVRDLLSRHRSRLTQPGAKPLDQHGLAAWQEFNDDYLLDIDRTAAQITVHYPKIDDATARLTELVRTEQSHLHFGDEDGIAAVAATIPAGRLATPEDIGNACLFMASPLASYAAGANLLVNGGGERPAFLAASRTD